MAGLCVGNGMESAARDGCRVQGSRTEAEDQVPPEGLEPGAVFPKETQVSGAGGSKSGNKPAGSGDPAAPEPPADPDLAAVVAAWPDLPAALRAGIVAMVKAAGER
jgi:hypothetical protein